MKIEKLGTCQYCGKQKFINVDPEVTDEQITVLVTQTCDCDAAVAARGMKITEDAIKSLLGTESMKRGFDYEVDSDTIVQIKAICVNILNGLMDKVTLVEPNGDTIKLVRNGHAVKIQRTCKKQVAM
jgi:hypothetical protein